MKNQNEVNEIIEYYAGQKDAGSQDNLVAMLREIQETEGCISKRNTGIGTGADGHKRVLSWLYFEDVSKFEVRGLQP